MKIPINVSQLDAMTSGEVTAFLNSHAQSQARIAELEALLTGAVALLGDAAEPDTNQMAADWDRDAQELIRVATIALNHRPQ